jgi:uridine kinase
VAAKSRELEVIRGIFILTKENLTTEEVNKLFLATDNEGRKVFRVAAKSWELEALQGILNCTL